MHLPDLRLPHLPTASGSRSRSPPPTTDGQQHQHQHQQPRQRRSTFHSTADVKPARPPPTGLLDATRSWVSMGEREAAKSELRILRRMPYFRLPHEPDPEPSLDPMAGPSIVARQYQLEVLPGQFLNALEIRLARPPTSPSSPPPTQDEGEDESGEAYVVAHGYGCGLCHYWRNFDTMAALTQATGMRTFLLDWMGMGRSTRRNPKVFAPMRKMSEADGVKAAEDFFLDPLLSFFKLKQITKAALIGHSLGGYLCAAFALRYPAHVKSLMLLSPAGIPSHPAPPTTPPPTPTTSQNQSRRPSAPTEDGAPVAGPSSSSSERDGVDGKRLEQALLRTASRDAAVADAREASWDSPAAARQFEAAVESGAAPDEAGGVIHEDSLAATDDDGDDDADDGKRKPQTFKGPLGNGRLMQATYAFMWEAGWSPLGFLRKAGPVGPLMLGKYSRARFASLAPDEQNDLNSYLTSITLLPGSGEYAVGILLRPGAFARFPIAERIGTLPVDVPVQLVYGALDWMDVHGGRDCVRALRKAGNRQGEVAVAPDAGHHMYLEQPAWQNDYLRSKLLPSAAADDSPPATPASSGTPTPSSTTLNTPRMSVSHAPLPPASSALGKEVLGDDVARPSLS